MRRLGSDEWLSLVAEYEQGGLSQKEFVAKHDVSFNTFQYWLYRRSRKSGSESGSPTQFLPVEVIPSPALEARAEGSKQGKPARQVPPEVEVELPSGLRIRFEAGAPAQYVAELVVALS